MTNNKAINAALNITLDSIERRTGRAWSQAERAYALKSLHAMQPFDLSQAASIAWQLTGQAINDTGRPDTSNPRHPGHAVSCSWRCCS